MRPITSEEAKEIVMLAIASVNDSIQKYCELVEVEGASMEALLDLEGEEKDMNFLNMKKLEITQNELSDSGSI